MVVTLALLGLVSALAAHVGLGQLRFFRGIGEVIATRTQLAHARDIASAIAMDLSPLAGDVLAATDSALEVRATIGAGVVCESISGRVSTPQPAATGATLATFTDLPAAGDLAAVFLDDSAAGLWMTFHVASGPSLQGSCAIFGDPRPAISLQLAEQVALPLGAPVRFLRPFRLSLYQSADGRWYLGARDWNGTRLNSIQPLAGPLDPYSSDPNRTGFAFSFRDERGSMVAGTDSNATSLRVVARGATTRPVRVDGLGTDGTVWSDSAISIVALRNRR